MAITKRLRADGTPAYRVVVHSPSQGHMTIGTFDRKRDAEIAEAEYKRQSKLEGVIFIPRDTPFNKVASDWLASLRVRPQSYMAFSSRAGHAIYHFDTKPIKDITKQDCEDYVNHLLDTGLAHATVNSSLSVLKRIMAYAVECGYVKQNKALTVKRLKLKTGADALRVIPPEAHQRLVQASGEYWSTLVYIWPFVGLRAGEIVALKWSDINLKERYIDVQRQRLMHTREIADTKSDSSNRKVYFSKAVADKLRLWKLRCPNTTDDWVFPTPWGGSLKYSYLQKNLIPLLREACNMPELTTHDFRHTFVSYLIRQGADIKYVQHQCGHSSAQVTLDTYGHMLPASEYAYADRVQEWYVTTTSPREEKPQVSATRA